MEIAALAERIAVRRGALGLRAAARDAGISPSTLSRVENGHIPDLETFERLCRWLGEDPNRFLSTGPVGVVANVQFRKQATATKETAIALGSLILRVQEMLEREVGSEEQT